MYGSGRKDATKYQPVDRENTNGRNLPASARNKGQWAPDGREVPMGWSKITKWQECARISKKNMVVGVVVATKYQQVNQ